MSIYKILGVTVIGLFATVILRKMKEEYATVCSAVICVSLLIVSLEIISPIAEQIMSLTSFKGVENYLTLMFKSCGVGIICCIASEICRDCGESALASKVELCGKCIVLSMCFPLISSALEGVFKLIT